MDTQFCRVETEGRVMTVTLDRPEARNALHSDASYELAEVFDAFEADPALWVAILTGAGDKSFCAGADLRTQGDRSRPPVPPTGFAGLVSRFDRLKPVIAAVNGTAMGGGFEAALACDIIIAADSASFGLTEPRVGLAALGGGIQRLIREIGAKRAHALLLTGRKITAADAAGLGLVAELVPQAQVLATARRWADEIMACAPSSIAATKAIANRLDGQTVAQSMGEMFGLPEVKALFTSPNCREGGKAFAEKRSPVWVGIGE